MMESDNPHIGSSLDDWLKEEGIYEEATAHAIRRILGWRVEIMKLQQDSKSEMSRVYIHPGEVLREDCMRPLNLSIDALARKLRVPPSRIRAIIRSKNPRPVTADMALRLARYFGTSAEIWTNVQSAYDLSVAAATHGEEIEREIQPREAA